VNTLLSGIIYLYLSPGFREFYRIRLIYWTKKNIV
jgi:hypothetical protein